MECASFASGPRAAVPAVALQRRRAGRRGRSERRCGSRQSALPPCAPQWTGCTPRISSAASSDNKGIPAGPEKEERHLDPCEMAHAEDVWPERSFCWRPSGAAVCGAIGLCVLSLAAATSVSAGAPSFQEDADTLMSEGSYQAALGIYNEELEDHPDSRAALWGRAAAEEGVRDYRAAVADYTAIVRQLAPQPADPLVYFERARAEGALGQWAEASRDYGLAADGFLGQRDRRSFGAAQGLRGVTAFQAGDVEESKRVLEGLRRGRYNSDVRAALVAVYWSEGDAETAEDLWQSTCDIDSAQCSRYFDSRWLREVRGWPPRLVDAMQSFLALKA